MMSELATFVSEDHDTGMGVTATKRWFRADSEAEARKFLEARAVEERFHHIIVVFPDGALARDIDAIYTPGFVDHEIIGSVLASGDGAEQTNFGKPVSTVKDGEIFLHDYIQCEHKSPTLLYMFGSHGKAEQALAAIPWIASGADGGYESRLTVSYGVVPMADMEGLQRWTVLLTGRGLSGQEWKQARDVLESRGGKKEIEARP